MFKKARTTEANIISLNNFIILLQDMLNQNSNQLKNRNQQNYLDSILACIILK